MNAVGLCDQGHTKHHTFAYGITLVHCLAVNAIPPSPSKCVYTKIVTLCVKATSVMRKRVDQSENCSVRKNKVKLASWFDASTAAVSFRYSFL